MASASVCKVIIIGNLGADPTTRTMPDGDMVTNIAVATTESWKDKNSGERKEITEWHRIVLYRRLAEIASKYLKKGSQVYIEGRLRTRKWTDREGVERTVTEIIADSMQMLGGRLTETGMQDRAEVDGHEASDMEGGAAPTPDDSWLQDYDRQMAAEAAAAAKKPTPPRR